MFSTSDSQLLCYATLVSHERNYTSSHFLYCLSSSGSWVTFHHHHHHHCDMQRRNNRASNPGIGHQAEGGPERWPTTTPLYTMKWQHIGNPCTVPFTCDCWLIASWRPWEIVIFNNTTGFPRKHCNDMSRFVIFLIANLVVMLAFCRFSTLFCCYPVIFTMCVQFTHSVYFTC